MNVKGRCCLEKKKKHGIFASLVKALDAGVGAHLVVVDSEVGLLAPEVPLYDRPALKPNEQL